MLKLLSPRLHTPAHTHTCSTPLHIVLTPLAGNDIQPSSAVAVLVSITVSVRQNERERERGEKRELLEEQRYELIVTSDANFHTSL